ncbi:MAG TPA: endonuclease III [Myxococcota bacterium]|nr:endonuclease III [Myxococcota bacterium]
MPRESQADRKKRALRIHRKLAKAYPDADCALRYETPFQLLIATILSAQCTDKMVNSVTPALFARYPDARAMSRADPADVEALIRPTGFFRQKTKSLVGTSSDLVEKFGGEVPRTLEELTALRGVARKTANVVLGNAFGVPGLTVDTHMKRIHQRLGLTRHDDPVKIERDLMELIPREAWTLYSHRVIHHGRVCCDARKPRCEGCPLRSDCPWPDSAAARASRKKKKTAGRKPSGPPGRPR